MDRKFLEDLGIAAETIDGILAEHNKAVGANSVTRETKPLGVSQEDYDKVVAELEALKAGSMSEEERIAAANEKASKAEAKYKMALSKLEVEKVFVSAGLTEDEYKPLVEQVASADEKLSKALAEQIAQTIKAKTEAAEKTVRENLMKDTPEVPDDEPSGAEGEISLGAQMAEAYGAKFQ